MKHTFLFSLDPDDTDSSSSSEDSSTDTSTIDADTSLDTDDSSENTSSDSAPEVPKTSTGYFFVDVYSQDLHGAPAWDVLVNDARFYGAILKATQGTKGWSNDKGWFARNWPLLKTVAGDRYGSTWFRGAYLFLNFWQDGADQADNYLDVINDAGGWDNGDIIPIVDVELGQDGTDGKHKRNPNRDASAQKIIDCTTACAERIKSVTGRNVMLYGRGAMRDKGITDKMGCDAVWNPAYTRQMTRHGLEAWTLDDIALWQYCGDGSSALDETKFPKSIPGFGSPDISVYIQGADKPSFDTMLQRLGIGS